MTVRVYTDGASSPNGHGGWAALLFADGALIDGSYGGAKDTTNNKMELQGIIGAMDLLPTVKRHRCNSCGVTDTPHFPEHGEGCEYLGTIMRPVYADVTIVSDSQYCINGATVWMANWKANGWKTKDKKPVKNQDLWEKIDKLLKLHFPNFEWVKGHTGDHGNEMADKYAGLGKMAMYSTSVSEGSWKLQFAE